MKKLLLYLIMASGFMFASCQGDQNNQNAEETRGSGLEDEIGGPEDGFDADVQGEDNLGGEAIGTEEDSAFMEADSTEMQQQDQFQ